MDIGPVHRAPGALVEAWRKNPSFRRQQVSSTVDALAPVFVRSPYSEYPEHYRVEFARLREVMGKNTFQGREALVAGCGSSAEEALLLLDNFPGLSRVHLVDWYRPHIDRLETLLRWWARNDSKRDYRKIEIHLANLMSLDSFRSGSIDLIYSHYVFEHIQGPNGLPDLETIGEIAGELRRVSVGGGVQFLLEYNPMPEVIKIFENLGIYRVSTQPDIWRKVR